MDSAPSQRLTNLVAALCTAVADDIHADAEGSAQLSGAAAAALVSIHEGEAGSTIDRLRVTIGLTPSGAVRMVDRLVEAGWVTRQRGGQARNVAVRLTPAGRRVARRIRDQRAERVTALLGHLSSAEQKSLTALAEKLVGALADDRWARAMAGRTPPGGAMCRLCDFTACGRPDGRCPAANPDQRADQ